MRLTIKLKYYLTVCKYVRFGSGTARFEYQKLALRCQPSAGNQDLSVE